MRKAAKVVVIVFDGLRPDMVTSQRMPRLAEFAGRNAWFREARSVFPSMTRVATASIATGAPPSVHGVVGNAFYFPEVTRDFVLDISNPDDIRLAESVLGGPLLTAETFADLLAKRGLSFAVVHTGSAGSCYAINPRVVANGHWTFSVLGERHTRTPHAVSDVVARFGPLPPRNLPRFEEIEYAAKAFTEYVLRHLAPDVALIWFNEPDTTFHYRFIGSEESRRVLAAADDAFGRILDVVKAMSDADDIAVIVASDHGQIGSGGTVAMDRLLSEAGHPAAMAAARNLAGAKVAVTGGNMGEIRMLDGDIDRRDAIARWLMSREEIGMVFMASNDPVHGAVAGTFSTKLAALDHSRGPDLAYVLRSDSGPDAEGMPGLGLITAGDVPVGGGMHGGFNRHELNTVLILGGAAAAGRATVSVAPSGIVDIGPTILDLMGLERGPAMTGASLLTVDPNMAASTVTHEAVSNAFRQRLAFAMRGPQRFPIHGGRI
jgi:hypothetical protein